MLVISSNCLSYSKTNIQPVNQSTVLYSELMKSIKDLSTEYMVREGGGRGGKVYPMRDLRSIRRPNVKREL